MTPPIFSVIDGIQREVTSIHVTIDGVERELDSMTAQIDGVEREIFKKSAPSILPEGYTVLPYIRSHGLEHIDTELKPSSRTRVVFDFENTGDYSKNSGQFATLFGARNGTSSAAFSMWVKQTGEVYPQYGSVAYYENGNFSVDLNERRIYELNKNVATAGCEIITCKTASFLTSHNLLLFTTNNNGTVETRKAVGKMFSGKIYDDDTSTSDYVPCKNPLGVIGLYDLVKKGFRTCPTMYASFTGGETFIFADLVCGGTLIAERGMTWGAWVASEYNTGDYWIDEDGYVRSPLSDYVVSSGWAVTAKKTTRIEAYSDWGLTSRAGTENPLISFTVNGESYIAKRGMTFGEWVDSEQNTGNFAVRRDGIIYGNEGDICAPDTYYTVYAPMIIEEDSEWIMAI